MRLCPRCGYAGPGAPAACAVCGADLAGAAALPDGRPASKVPWLLVAGGLAVLLFGAYGYFPRRPAAVGEKAPLPAEAPGYDGVLYSLEKMAALRFLPDRDKLAALRHLQSPDDKVGHAAARAAGAWIRSGVAGETELRLFEGLLEAAASGRPAVRRQAAFEAGLAAAFGFPAGRHADRAAVICAALAAEADPALMGAGFFLASMTGSRALVPEMRAALAGGDGEAALHAACALSRLGESDGTARLEEIAGGTSPLKPEALGCLGYSASPRAGAILGAAASEPGSGAAAESAKRALILRKQLGIIKSNARR